MTSSSTFKKHVREYAAQHDVSYTEARRILTDAMTDLIDRAETLGNTPLQERTLTIQRATDSDGKLPMPFFVHPSGHIRRQDHWKGQPYFLIGFEDPAAAAASPDGHDVTVSRREWFENPQSVIGMLAITADRQGTWATWNDPVETVKERDITLSDPSRAILRLTIPGLDFDEEIPVGHLIERLIPADLIDAGKHGWRDCAAVDELLWIAFLTEDPVARSVEPRLDDLDRDTCTITVTGPAVGIGEDQE